MPTTFLDKFKVKAGTKVEAAAVQKGLSNAAKIAAKIPTVVFEHHILRSENWREEIRNVYDAGLKAGHRVITAADLAGVPPNLLEATRPRLYESNPPPEAFMKWCKLSREVQRQTPPPL